MYLNIQANLTQKQELQDFLLEYYAKSKKNVVLVSLVHQDLLLGH